MADRALRRLLLLWWAESPYSHAMVQIALTEAQARFVGYVVAQGRYRDAAEVVTAALAALERLETERTALEVYPAVEPPDGCDPLRGKVWLAPDMAAAPDELIELMGGGGR